MRGDCRQSLAGNAKGLAPAAQALRYWRASVDRGSIRNSGQSLALLAQATTCFGVHLGWVDLADRGRLSPGKRAAAGRMNRRRQFEGTALGAPRAWPGGRWSIVSTRRLDKRASVKFEWPLRSTLNFFGLGAGLYAAWRCAYMAEVAGFCCLCPPRYGHQPGPRDPFFSRDISRA